MKRKPLKQIYQLDPTGCTYACVAMIANKKYFEIRELVSNIIPSLSAKNMSLYITSPGLLPGQIKDVLNYLNIRSKWIKFESLNKLKNNAILLICKIDKNDFESGHAIVFDKLNKKILDPGFGANISLDSYNICGCLEILRYDKSNQY